MSGRYKWKLGEALPILGGHSVAKLDIFELYIGIYIERLTRTPSQTVLNLTIVDGFSGGGIYAFHGNEVEGSPLRLLHAVEVADRALKAARVKGFEVRADFFFVDDNPEHIAFLRDLLTRRGFASRIDRDIFIQCDTFENACPPILGHIQNKGTAQRSLFFLDQYGWSDVRLNTIRVILNRLHNPEIMLTFAVDSLIDHLSMKRADTEALLRIELAREDVRTLMEMRSGEGWRYLIQNGLYHYVQLHTVAKYYTPFFIHSVKSHRSYWLLHLSKHRQARDEMRKLHWRLNNHFQHHGGAGFHALGFDPSHDLRQEMLTFMFDDDAMRRSEAAVLDQLPRMIHAASREGNALSVEALFTGNCNDTPVTSDILNRQLVLLRDEGEVILVAEDGTRRPRTTKVSWTDGLVLPRERSLFSRLGW